MVGLLSFSWTPVLVAMKVEASSLGTVAQDAAICTEIHGRIGVLPIEYVLEPAPEPGPESEPEIEPESTR